MDCGYDYYNIRNRCLGQHEGIQGNRRGVCMKALDLKGSKDQSGVVAFGDNSLIDSFVSKSVFLTELKLSQEGFIRI